MSTARIVFGRVNSAEFKPGPENECGVAGYADYYTSRQHAHMERLSVMHMHVYAFTTKKRHRGVANCDKRVKGSVLKLSIHFWADL